MQIKSQGIDLSIECGPPATEGWRVAHVKVSVPGFNGSYQCQLITDDLKVFQAQLKQMSRSVGQECSASLITTDPGIRIVLKMDKLGNIHGRYALRNFGSFGEPTLEGGFAADQTFLAAWRDGITEEIK
jgi:hypothetical protein